MFEACSTELTRGLQQASFSGFVNIAVEFSCVRSVLFKVAVVCRVFIHIRVTAWSFLIAVAVVRAGEAGSSRVYRYSVTRPVSSP